MVKQIKKRYSSLENALRLLDLFSVEKSEWKVKEIAEVLHIAESTAHRLLTTLEEEGFIVKDFISNSYRLGVSILSLNLAITSKMSIIKQSTPILQELSMKFHETAQIGVLQGKHVYYINRIDYEHPVFGTETYFADRKAPVYCTSAGKILMSQLSEQDILRYAEHGLHKYTDATIVNPDSLLDERKKASSNGFATSYKELHNDVSSIAVPILDRNNKVTAALELIGPSESIRENRMKEMAEVLKEAADILSKK